MRTTDITSVTKKVSAVQTKKRTTSAGKKTRGKLLEYDPIFAEKLLEFFSIPPFEVLEIAKKDGTISFVEKAAQLPTFAAFARTLQVPQSLLKQWEENYTDFADAAKKARDLQENILIQNSLRGNYSASFAVFTAKNILGWRDGKEDNKKQDGILKIKWEE